MRIVAFILTLVVLTGCAVGPDYSRPDLQVPIVLRRLFARARSIRQRPAGTADLVRARLA